MILLVLLYVLQGFLFTLGGVIALFSLGLAGGAFEEWRNRRYTLSRIMGNRS